MPELPDLQAFSQNLDKRLSGKTLQEINPVNASKLKIKPKELKDALENQKLVSVYREGKELRFEFKNGNVLGMHLMLRGKLHLFEETNKEKNTIVELLFTDKTGLALTDNQGMANASLNAEKRDAPDALSKEADYTFLKEKMKTRKEIKALLLDQKIILGIGNAYADEILWDALISPFSICNKIPDDKIKALAHSIKSVLKNAEKQILKSNPDIISGEIRDFLNIHNARKTHSPTGGVILKKENPRPTYYTDEQELYK